MKPFTYYLLLFTSSLSAQTADPYVWDASTHPPQTARLQGRLLLSAPGRAGEAGPLDLEVAWPTVRAGDGRRLEPRAAAALLPLGDPLAYLAMGHGARAAGEETVGERSCRRLDFLVGGRAYQAWWERHRAFAPFNADAGGMTTFSATGSVWLDPETQLPCRIALRAELPRTPGEGRGSAAVDWTYAWER